MSNTFNKSGGVVMTRKGSTHASGLLSDSMVTNIVERAWNMAKQKKHPSVHFYGKTQLNDTGCNNMCIREFCSIQDFQRYMDVLSVYLSNFILFRQRIFDMVKTHNNTSRHIRLFLCVSKGVPVSVGVLKFFTQKGEPCASVEFIESSKECKGSGTYLLEHMIMCACLQRCRHVIIRALRGTEGFYNKVLVLSRAKKTKSPIATIYHLDIDDYMISMAEKIRIERAKNAPVSNREKTRKRQNNTMKNTPSRKKKQK